jgi:hypothetical protein
MILRDLTGGWWFNFQRTTNICYISTQYQEGKFQKHDVSRVTCLSKPITQQFYDNNSSIEIDNRCISKFACTSSAIIVKQAPVQCMETILSR